MSIPCLSDGQLAAEPSGRAAPPGTEPPPRPVMVGAGGAGRVPGRRSRRRRGGIGPPSLRLPIRKGPRLAALVLMAAMAGARGANEMPAAGVALDLTFERAVALALRNNRGLMNSRLDRAAQRLSLRVAENEFRPRLTISPYLDGDPAGNREAGTAADVSVRFPTGADLVLGWKAGARDSPRGFDERYFSTVGLTLTQPLARGAGREVTLAAVRTARIVEGQNLLALRQAVIGVVSSVTGAYRAYMQAERRVEIRIAALARARELLEVNDLLVKSGRMAAREVVQARTGIARAEIALVEAQDNLDAARLALVDLLDVDSGVRLRVTDPVDADALDPEPPRHGPAAGVEIALRRRPDYLRQELALRQAKTQLTVARDERRWDLSLTLSADLQRDAGALGRAVGDLGDATGYGARVDLAIPVGRAATDSGRLREVEADAAVRKARNGLANLRQGIEIEVSGAVRAVERAGGRIDLVRAVRRLVEEQTRIEQEKLRAGLSSNFQLLAFEDDQVAAYDEELRAVFAYLAAVDALDRALGVTLETRRIDVEAAFGPDPP